MTREEARQAYVRMADALGRRIGSEHSRYAGRTFISRFEFGIFTRTTQDLREELGRVRAYAEKEYLTLAPDRRAHVASELADLELAISEFESAVRSVFVGNPHEVIEQGVATIPVHETVEETHWIPMATGGAYPVTEKKRVQTGTQQVPYTVRRVDTR